MIPKKSTQLLWHPTPEKSCSTILIRRILVSDHVRARIAIKKLYYTARNRLVRKVWAKEQAFFPKISTDINIIENVCSLVKKEFSKDFPKILRNFGNFVKKKSKEYLQSTFKTYIVQFQIHYLKLSSVMEKTLNFEFFVKFLVSMISVITFDRIASAGDFFDRLKLFAQ